MGSNPRWLDARSPWDAGGGKEIIPIPQNWPPPIVSFVQNLALNPGGIFGMGTTQNSDGVFWDVWDGLNPGGMGGVSSCRSQCARRKTGGVRVSQQPIRWQSGNEHLLGGNGWPCVRQCMGLSRSSGCQTVSGDLCLIVSTSPPSDDGLWPWTGVQLQHNPASTIPTWFWATVPLLSAAAPIAQKFKLCQVSTSAQDQFSLPSQSFSHKPAHIRDRVFLQQVHLPQRDLLRLLEVLRPYHQTKPGRAPKYSGSHRWALSQVLLTRAHLPLHKTAGCPARKPPWSPGGPPTPWSPGPPTSWSPGPPTSWPPGPGPPHPGLPALPSRGHGVLLPISGGHDRSFRGRAQKGVGKCF